MLPGFDAVTNDGGLAQRLGGLKSVQALDQHEARAVGAHQDRCLLALREHAVRDRIDALQVERLAPCGRHVDMSDWEGLAFQHVDEGTTIARAVRLTPTKPSTARFSLKYLIAFARERVSSAVIEFPYARAIDALFVHFQHSAQQKIGWHYLDSETDSLGRGFEPAIAGRAITLCSGSGTDRLARCNQNPPLSRLNGSELVTRPSDSQPTSYPCWIPLRTQQSAPH
jgi:hypothetical protein